MPRKSTATPTMQEDWMEKLRESSHDVILAGLAALARTRSKVGGKPARSDFDTLVAEGRRLEPDLRETVQKAWDDLRERSRSTMGVMPVAGQGRLQGVFQERVAAAVRSLGLPSRDELDALNARLDGLLQAQAGRGPARKTKAAAKAVAKKATAARRKTSARKPVAR
ncbi:MAG: phasin family protein [Rubrivivax sp.]|nr:phasin family protein [Rubrivivax sp.]